MKTTEEKRVDLLAEFNRIGLKIDSAPILIGDGLEICMGYIQEGIGNNIQHEAVYLFFAGKTVAVFWSKCSDDQIGLFHRLLGLEARDAVAEKEAQHRDLLIQWSQEREKVVDALRQVREVEAKSAALVEAVNQAIFDLTDEDADPREDAYDFGQRIAAGLEKALKAHKKGGMKDA